MKTIKKINTIKYLYVTSSSYSGSTLLAFLLNAHPNMVSVSEMDGWRYGPNDVYLCSCEKPLKECLFFSYIYESFGKRGLKFDFREFGTRYELSNIGIINRWLMTSISRVHNTKIEKIRDNMVWKIPSLSKKLLEIDQANETFVKVSLDYSKSEAFADVCKDPFRLRHLRRISSYDISIIYLTRDPRGVVFSRKKVMGLDTSTCVRLWLYEQYDICRILSEFPAERILKISYEELCKNPDQILNKIFRLMNLPPHRYDTENLKLGEHHIIGNTMRLKKLKKITESKKWNELSASEQVIIHKSIIDFDRKIRHPVLAEVIESYLHLF